MSTYTTGEIAKLCGISVRTVQYYDARNILVPSNLSDGGRRLYSEEDLKRLKTICFLREGGVPISRIHELFTEKHPEKVLSILLEQQEKVLLKEIDEGKKRLAVVENIRHELKEISNFSVDSIGDIAHIMKNKNKLRKLLWYMLLTGIPVTILQWTSIILWIILGLWWMFPLWVVIAWLWGTAISIYYYNRVSYICPECHEIFKPKFKEMFWAYHTPKMRRLTCPKCGHKGLCVEIITEREMK